MAFANGCAIRLDDLKKQILKDLQALRDRDILGVSEEAFEWLVVEVVADITGGKYEWVEKKGGKRGGKISTGA